MSTKLGQNFLINENIARKIAESAHLSSADNILEIGPGKGILTKYLTESAGKILAVEVDKNLIRHLQSRLKKNNDAVVEGDILKINLPKLIRENNFENYRVVANLPYYITSKIIRLLLETAIPPTEMILMVQKEVGERIVALDGKESILSISVKFYADLEILFYVPRENFEPAPEVDSAVIRIKRNVKFSDVAIKKFFALVRAGFSAKRKTLANNLSASFHIPKVSVFEILKKADLEPTVRAERLEVDDWKKLFDVMNEQY